LPKQARLISSAPAAFSQIPPHLLIENAFGGAMVERLLALASTREATFGGTTVGRREVENKQIRRSRVTRDFGDMRVALEAAFRARLHHAISALRLAPFTVESLSLELAAHGDGDFYRRHIDTFTGDEKARRDRILTGVYYFHTLPKAFTGGELRLFSLRPVEQGGTYLDIAPPCDSLLLFPAWVPHEVLPVSCPEGGFAQSRFAINCWYNGTTSRPA
jgi:Rps23 Pro-64 3,4-dihydroxylase Tpa1-like proline 4-hydroxylase